MGNSLQQDLLQAEEQILECRRRALHHHRLVAEVGVSQFVVDRTLKKQDLDPYHVQKVQAL